MNTYDEKFRPIFHCMNMLIEKLDENDIYSYAGEKVCKDFALAFVNLVNSTVKNLKK